LHPAGNLSWRGERVLIGYVRVSKSDGTQTLAPQRDVLLAAGVAPDRIYEDLEIARPQAEAKLAELQERAALAREAQQEKMQEQKERDQARARNLGRGRENEGRDNER